MDLEIFIPLNMPNEKGLLSSDADRHLIFWSCITQNRRREGFKKITALCACRRV